MHFVFTPFAIPLFLAALVAAGVAGYTWKHRASHVSALPLTWLMGDVVLWLLAYSLEILSGDLPGKELWETLVTISQAFIGPLWLIFAIQYAERPVGRRPLTSWLLISPGLLTAALALTNPWHHLLWTQMIRDASAPFPAIFPSPGPWFWVLAVYRYLYVLSGTSLVLLTLVRSPAWYRRQGLLVAAGGLLPLLGNSLHILDLVHILWIDLGPLAFLIAGLLLALALFTYRLLDIIPLAHRAIFESMREGVMVLDNQDRLVDANPAARQMLTLSHQDVGGGSKVSDILPQAMQAYLRGTPSEQNEFSLPQGEPARWLRPSLSPLTDRRGQLLARLLVLHDVTEEHALDELRNDLIRMMVHDLRNPLSVVYGSIELLIMEVGEQLDARGRKMLDVIKVSNMQCLGIVNRILDLHRLETGQMPLELESVSLPPLLHQLVQQMSPLADVNRLQLGLDIKPHLPPARADPRLLERILQNLVGNAIKFTPAGGMVRVGARKWGDDLQVWVSDTGPGIPPDLQRRLFQKFVTGPSKQRGSGLGLAFCRLAVEAHGGRIWVESREGQGSTFYFTLPGFSPARTGGDPVVW